MDEQVGKITENFSPENIRNIFYEISEKQIEDRCRERAKAKSLENQADKIEEIYSKLRNR